MTLLLVDAPALMFRAFSTRAPLSRSDGEPVGTLYNALKMMLSTIRRRRPAAIVFAFEGSGQTFRHALDPSYKANRQPRPADMHAETRHFDAMCRCMGRVESVAGFEADDILATHARLAAAAGHDALVMSPDKDLLALVRPGVAVLSRKPGTTPGPAFVDALFESDEDVRAVWGVSPTQIPDLLALMGDSVDNIPGLPGVGRKRAADIIRERGSLEAALANPCGPPSVRAALTLHGDIARRSRTLTQLRADVPVQGPPYDPINWSAVAEFCRRFEFTSLAGALENG